MPIADPARLLEDLCAEPRETEWLEFKTSYFDADEVGQYVSGLANSAILQGEAHAYLVFGVEDETHKIVGTTVSLKDAKVGNEVFENWLTRSLDPKLTVEIVEFLYDGLQIVIVIIDPAYQRPVRFKTEAFIRIATVKKLLREYPEREKALWAMVSRFTFEQGTAAYHQSAEQILEKFDCRLLVSLLKRPAQSNPGLIDLLLMEKLILDDRQGGFDATNLLALLFARDLSAFPAVKSKSPRVVQYQSKDKLTGVSDETGNLGYAISFPRVLKYIMQRVPQKEEMRHGIRVKEFLAPEIAIREFLANSFIHQDLSIEGRPFIEIFSDRVQITSPGAPLVSTERFIDAPARSRNEQLAGLMRRLGYCEERGSGIDRAVDAIEEKALPPPLFRVVENSTMIVLQGELLFAQMTKDERLRACYQHASLRYIAENLMTNGSLRRRLGLRDNQYPQVSIVIRDAIDAGLIKPLDADQGNRNARYVPVWA